MSDYRTVIEINQFEGCPSLELIVQGIASRIGSGATGPFSGPGWTAALRRADRAPEPRAAGHELRLVDGHPTSCPWCNNDQIAHTEGPDGAFAVCRDCGAQGPLNNTRAGAVVAWVNRHRERANSRAEQPPAGAAALVTALEFYAEESNWKQVSESTPDAWDDEGELARETLAAYRAAPREELEAGLHALRQKVGDAHLAFLRGDLTALALADIECDIMRLGSAPREEPEAGAADLWELLAERRRRWIEALQIQPNIISNAVLAALDTDEAIVAALVGVARDAERRRG